MLHQLVLCLPIALAAAGLVTGLTSAAVAQRSAVVPVADLVQVLTSRDACGEEVASVSSALAARPAEAVPALVQQILEGPEYLTVFDGRTGAARATVDYVPPRGDVGGWGGIGGNGGNGGNHRTDNRVDRFPACVAYRDGRRPSAVMCRGV